MNRITKLISGVLVFAVLTAFCSCSGDKPRTGLEKSDTVKGAVETFEETYEETTEPSPTPTPEPTSTPIPTPVPVHDLDSVSSLLASCVGIPSSEAQQKFSEFFDVTLDNVYETTNYEGKPNYIFSSLTINVEGVYFDSMSIIASLEEDNVEYMILTSIEATPEDMTTSYSIFKERLDQIYGEPVVLEEQDTMCFALYYAENDVIINAGYLIGDGGSFWINVSPNDVG